VQQPHREEKGRIDLRFWVADPRGIRHRVGANRDEPDRPMPVKFLPIASRRRVVVFAAFVPNRECHLWPVADYVHLERIARLQGSAATRSIYLVNNSFPELFWPIVFHQFPARFPVRIVSHEVYKLDLGPISGCF
jgi:hypothetical protein